jgi:hypothetical protein
MIILALLVRAYTNKSVVLLVRISYQQVPKPDQMVCLLPCPNDPFFHFLMGTHRAPLPNGVLSSLAL